MDRTEVSMSIHEAIDKLKELASERPELFVRLEITRWPQFQVRYADGSVTHSDVLNDEQVCRRAQKEFKDSEGAVLYTRDCVAVKVEGATTEFWRKDE